MMSTVFAQGEFWLLVVFSFVVPLAIYAVLLVKRAISRATVLVLGLALVAVAGYDVYLLQSLAGIAKATPTLVDDALFTSEVSIALYILPALFAGVGVNVISHVLIRHLERAETRFESEHREV
jgi:hypothetical protein